MTWDWGLLFLCRGTECTVTEVQGIYSMRPISLSHVFSLLKVPRPRIPSSGPNRVYPRSPVWYSPLEINRTFFVSPSCTVSSCQHKISSYQEATTSCQVTLRSDNFQVGHIGAGVWFALCAPDDLPWNREPQGLNINTYALSRERSEG